MRRNDREMDREFGLKVIDKSRFGIMSMLDKDEPYGIPLSIVRDEDTLYFHSAMDGRKVKVLGDNPKVSVAFVGETVTPDLYSNEELDEITKDESNAGLLISKVFTIEFESAVVTGKVRLVDDEKERVKAMRLICEKYTPAKMAYFPLAVKSGGKRVNVYAIDIKDVTAKRKKYNKDGKELKWGATE